MKVFDCIIAVSESGRYNSCCENMHISIVANSFSEAEAVFNQNKGDIIKDLSERLSYLTAKKPKYVLEGIKVHDDAVFIQDENTGCIENAN